MQERIGLEAAAQPKAEGEEGVARWERRIVIGGTALMNIAAVWRQRDEDVAETGGAEAEGAVAHIGIAFRIAPRRRDATPCFSGQFGEKQGVVGERKRRLVQAELELREQHTRGFGAIPHVVSRHSEV